MHSPFIYRLLDEVIYDHASCPAYEAIEKKREELLKDKRWIEVTDLGAGSVYGNRKKKQIAQMAKRALKPPKLAQLFFRLSRYLKPATTIELGTSLGITSAYLSAANPGGTVYTIEGCPQTAAVAREVFKGLGLKNVVPHTGNFDERFPELLSGIEKLDLLYIDGNHRREATLRYFEWALPRLQETSLVILDDIHWSGGMQEAWKTIKAHPDVTVTADLFYIGLVFFHKGQAKQHFSIKI